MVAIIEFPELQEGVQMNPAEETKIIVADIKMPFISMVIFMVKWAIAAIPAIIILFILGAILSGIFGSLFLGIGV